MENHDRPSEERRNFIARCGRFALVTPPAIALLLAADGRNYADAASGGEGNNERPSGKNKKNRRSSMGRPRGRGRA